MNIGNIWSTTLIDFPKANLKPQYAKLNLNGSGNLSFEIIFESFSLPDPTDAIGENLEFNGALRADFAQLLANDLGEVQNRIIDFPKNPEDGFVDASLYFARVHNPVDITRIEFGSLTDREIMLTITSNWVMSFERTGFEDFDYDFSVMLKI